MVGEVGLEPTLNCFLITKRNFLCPNIINFKTKSNHKRSTVELQVSLRNLVGFEPTTSRLKGVIKGTLFVFSCFDNRRELFVGFEPTRIHLKVNTLPN